MYTIVNMKFDELLVQFGDRPVFERSDITLMFRESENSIRTSLQRLKKSGKILELKRGLYAFSEPWRKAVLHGPVVANLLYHPSYISGLWALSWYGIIPEKVVLTTSITTRPTRVFENSFGQFSYRTIKQELFSGWNRITLSGAQVQIASPEKALADYLYLESGEWDEARMDSMRFDPHGIDTEKLATFLELTGQSRLLRALDAWRRYAADIEKGTVIV